MFQQGNMRFQQQVEVPSTLRCRKDDAPLEVEVRPGMRHGEVVIFPNEGEQKKDKIPGDVMVSLEQIPHKYTSIGLSIPFCLVCFLKFDVCNLTP